MDNNETGGFTTDLMKRERLKFLVTNDDGYQSLGIRVIKEILESRGEVVIVAPDKEMSATSHSLTLSRPLRVNRHEQGVFSVDGTPTDCVMLAVNGLVSDRPDFLVSGINHGANLGDDVTYSGTVAAAIEGTLLGIPSIAVSFASRDLRYLPEWHTPLQRILEQITTKNIPKDTLLNVNLPPIPVGRSRGVKSTTLGKRIYQDAVQANRDDAGQIYYWIGGQKIQWKGNNSSDFVAIKEGFVSITPLHLDLTDYRTLEELSGWGITYPKEDN
jgi:5'-nucleotidase